MRDLTPRQIVAELDRHIVGQHDAKRAVAIAVRNRWRRQQLPAEMRGEIAPKNILMIGPTGVGKTEIARRLARLTGAPFIKVEATKYTEVGYYGRDVESMIRELVENAHRPGARDRAARTSRQEARRRVERPAARSAGAGARWPTTSARRLAQLARALRADARKDAGHAGRRRDGRPQGRNHHRAKGRADDAHRHGPGTDRHRPAGHVREDPAQANDAPRDDRGRGPQGAVRAGVRRADQPGEGQRRRRSSWPRTWASSSSTRSTRSWPATARGADVSRQGVQRDLLPIVEGTTVQTKYGYVKTDHILFIAAGAFHRAKPSDLMPELQGRFPIRVELKDLTQGRFRSHPDRAEQRADQAVPGPAGHRRGRARVSSPTRSSRWPTTPSTSTRRARTSAPGGCTRSWSGCSRS